MADKGKEKGTGRFREVRNVKARRDYFIEETLEAGVVLQGTEIKSIRAGKVQLNDAFVRVERGIPILYHCHIDEYSHGNRHNHNPLRPRRLLLHSREINRFRAAVEQNGRSIVPLRIYFKNGLAKVEIALAKGKKLYDKREDLKRRTELLEARRVVASRR